MALYQNGSSGATSTATASSLMSQPITILAQNDNGTIDHFSAMQIALGSIGGSMTSTQVSNIYSACTAICPPSARRVGADMAPATEMRSAGAANTRAHGGSVTLISRRHRVVTQAMLSSHRRMRVILASRNPGSAAPSAFALPRLGHRPVCLCVAWFGADAAPLVIGRPFPHAGPPTPQIASSPN
jgi:hypothetical protein